MQHKRQLDQIRNTVLASHWKLANQDFLMLKFLLFVAIKFFYYKSFLSINGYLNIFFKLLSSPMTCLILSRDIDQFLCTFMQKY